MRNIWTIAKREYKIYFNSPLAYIVMLAIIGVTGIIFGLNLFFIAQSPFNFGSVPDSRFITQPMAFLLVISAPALTMRLIADEQRMGTMELLLTAPIKDWELVIGKWLGAFIFLATIIAITLVYPLLLNTLVTPGIDQQLMLSGYLGVLLFSSAFLAIGVGVSALFNNQFAAFFVSMFIIIIFFYLIGAFSQILNNGSEIFRYLDMGNRFYDTLNQGVINLSDIVYFLSVTALGLFIGSIAVEMRRWQ